MNAKRTAQKYLITVVITITTVIFIIVLAGCTPGVPSGVSPEEMAATQQALVAQAAQATATMMAMQGEIAQLQTQVAAATQVPTLTRTPVSTPTATAIPPTATPVPPTPTATAVPIPCNQFEFVEDITVRDGTILPPGAGFTKIWRLKNTGACTWTSAYNLVFLSGDALQAATAYAMPGNVVPGQVIDLAVPMVAPTQAGSYRGYWQLRDAGGVLFGGVQQDAFYVDIKVEPSDTNYPYDFATNYCLAEWTTGAGRIPCQGDSGDSRGVIRRVDNPILENGYQDDEPLLLTQPQMITDGIIRGKYPAVRVEAGYSFAAIIGCANKSDGCDVNFQLDYQIGDGSIQTLGSWHEVYDETYHRVEVDLSPLAGNDVKFILTVLANGSSYQDKAQWLAPRIIKK